MAETITTIIKALIPLPHQYPIVSDNLLMKKTKAAVSSRHNSRLRDVVNFDVWLERKKNEAALPFPSALRQCTIWEGRVFLRRSCDGQAAATRHMSTLHTIHQPLPAGMLVLWLWALLHEVSRQYEHRVEQLPPWLRKLSPPLTSPLQMMPLLLRMILMALPQRAKLKSMKARRNKFQLRSFTIWANLSKRCVYVYNVV